jgi:hypothetical protein
MGYFDDVEETPSENFYNPEDKLSNVEWDENKWDSMGLPAAPGSPIGVSGAELTAQDILNKGYSKFTPLPSTLGQSNGGGTYYSPTFRLGGALGIAKSQLPTLKMPSYTAPVRDENRLSYLTQKAAAPGLRRLRGQTQSAIISSQSLPATVRKMTLREALAGYGEGSSQIMGGAARSAQNQYNQEFDDKSKESLLNYQAKSTEAKSNYQSELDRLWNNLRVGA